MIDPPTRALNRHGDRLGPRATPPRRGSQPDLLFHIFLVRPSRHMLLGSTGKHHRGFRQPVRKEDTPSAPPKTAELTFIGLNLPHSNALKACRNRNLAAMKRLDRVRQLAPVKRFPPSSSLPSP